MPDLKKFENQTERQEQSRAEKRRKAREQKQAKLLTFGEFRFWMDQYHAQLILPLRAELDWLMAPWYKRYPIIIRGFVTGLLDRIKGWRAGRAGRRAAQTAEENHADD